MLPLALKSTVAATMSFACMAASPALKAAAANHAGDSFLHSKILHLPTQMEDFTTAIISCDAESMRHWIVIISSAAYPKKLVKPTASRRVSTWLNSPASSW